MGVGGYVSVTEMTPRNDDFERTPPHDVELVRELCERILRQNWREGTMHDGTPFAFTAPSVGHYPWQFYWDSCFTAIAWRSLGSHLRDQLLQLRQIRLLPAVREDAGAELHHHAGNIFEQFATHPVVVSKDQESVEFTGE